VATDRYLVISSDTHAGPPSEAYRDYVDPEFREAFDRDLEQSLALRSLVLESASEEQERFRVEWEEETGDGGRRASYDPATRNAELDREGIAGEVIFPDADVLGGGASAPFSAGLQSSGELDGTLVQAGARAHNRWLAELCSESPERRCGVATIPIAHDVAWAVAEMERVADAGLRAMLIPTLWGSKPAYHDPVYEPVWSAAADLGLVVNVHSGGASKDILPGPGMVPIYATEAWWWAARPLWVLLWSGAFDRHPSLRFAITEDGAWWLPDIVERMDEKWIGGHNTRKFGSLFRDAVARRPSEYLGVNVFLGASTPSRHEVATRHRVGVRTLLWGNDFPHPEGTWPHTRTSIRDVFHDVPHDETAQMLGLTAAEVYRFDVDKLAGTVERIGPTVEEVHG
jgi:predicted TIM-barrel fold metal-dependent hydrolase